MGRVFARPRVGLIKEPIKQISAITAGGTPRDLPRFTATAHGIANTKSIEFLRFYAKPGGLPDKYLNLKYYNRLRGHQLSLVDANTFDLIDPLGENYQFAGDAQGEVAEVYFRSRFLAAFAPCLWIFERSDDKITLIDSNAGKMRITMDTLGSGSFTAGDQLFVRDHYKHDRIVTVNSATGTPAAVTMNDNFIDSVGHAWMISNKIRPQYRLEVEIYDDTDNSLLVGPLVYHSPQNGVILFDISEALQSLLSFEVMTTRTRADLLEAYVENNRQKKIYIKWLEKWTGSSETQQSENGLFEPTVIGASRDFNTYGGAALIEYEAHGARPESNPAKFLTKARKLKAWKDYPLSVHFLYHDITASSYGTGANVYIKYYEADGTLNDTQTLALPDTFSERMVRVTIPTAGLDEAVVSAQVQIVRGAEAYQYTEALQIEFVPVCSNPLYISFVNSLGADSYMLLDKDYQVEPTIDGAEAFRSPSPEIYNQNDTLTGKLPGSLSNVYTAEARHLDNTQLADFLDLLNSPRVWRLEQGTGLNWIRKGMIVATESHAYKISERLSNVQIKLEEFINEGQP